MMHTRHCKNAVKKVFTVSLILKRRGRKDNYIVNYR